jgi:hypothetical protein
MAEESTYSYQYPAEGILNMLYGTSGAPGFFPMLQSYYGNQLQNMGGADSSPYTYTGERIAGFAPREEYAMDLADQAVGQYQPYFDRQRQLTEQGINVTQQGAEEAARLFRETGQAQFDPSAYSAYEDPYTDAVTDKILEDLSKSTALQSQGLASNQVSQGAFGGSRGRISQEELQRSMTDQAVGALAGVRSQGYQQAQDRSANEFARQQQARYQSGQGIAGLAGQMAGQYGAAGQTYGGLGSQIPGMAREDVNLMMGIGGLQRGMGQAGLDLDYQNFVGQYNLPGQIFGQYGNFLGSLGPLAGGIGYSGVGEPPAYGNYGTGGYNPYMLPYAGTGQTGTGQTGTGTGNNTPYDPNATPGGPSTGGTVMAYGGQVPKMQEGGEVPTKTAQRMTSIAEMLKTLRES